MSDKVEQTVLEAAADNSDIEMLVQEIINTDNIAKQMIAGAKSKNENIAQAIAERKKQLRNDYVAESNKMLEKQAADERKNAEEEINRQAEKFEHAREELDKTFGESRDKWLDEIVARVTAI